VVKNSEIYTLFYALYLVPQLRLKSSTFCHHILFCKTKTYRTDTRTDRQTDRRLEVAAILRAYIASPGNKPNVCVYFFSIYIRDRHTY